MFRTQAIPASQTLLTLTAHISLCQLKASMEVLGCCVMATMRMPPSTCDHTTKLPRDLALERLKELGPVAVVNDWDNQATSRVPLGPSWQSRSQPGWSCGWAVRAYCGGLSSCS
ncbi:hypothetical protein WJX84_001360 [Apatococcus fuscideae]|uniref:Uncharacterized protein n=1 Tax=Apatococcus fuscideae TaxID=2026836 RepID=A0AAW1SKQ4_9CHLO